MVRDEAIKSLHTAKKILDDLGIPFFLFLGTALGAYRDRDFCPGDEDDIDLAVHIDHYAQKYAIIAAFKEAGFNAHEYIAEGAISPEIAFQRNVEGGRSKVDIFFIVPKDGKIIWTFYTPQAQNRSVTNNFLMAGRTEFFDETFNLPYPAEPYLEENYGPDWRTPIHRNQWDYKKDNKGTII